MLLLREASDRSYSYSDDAGSLLGTSDKQGRKAKLGGTLTTFPWHLWVFNVSRTLAVGKCRVHVTGRILYRIGFYHTWTYNDIYNMYNYMTYILVCDLHHYVSICKWPKQKLQLTEERFMLPEASVEHGGTRCRKFVAPRLLSLLLAGDISTYDMIDIKTLLKSSLVSRAIQWRHRKHQPALRNQWIHSLFHDSRP